MPTQSIRLLNALCRPYHITHLAPWAPLFDSRPVNLVRATPYIYSRDKADDVQEWLYKGPDGDASLKNTVPEDKRKWCIRSWFTDNVVEGFTGT